MKTNTCVWFSRCAALLFSVLGAVAPAQLFAQPATAPIIGGHDASPSAYPWMAALLDSSLDDTTEAHFCGASLIAPQYLATAAHCVTFFDQAIDPQSIEVMIGQSKLPFGRGDRKALIGVFVHPDFNPITLEHDVALLKLETPVSTPFLPVLQPGNDSLVSEASPATIIGWGKIDPDRSILPVDLQEVTVPIHSDSNCLKNLGRYFKPLTMICAGVLSSAPGAADGKDSCNGDSGGPIMVESSPGVYNLAGTVSWGFACADNRTYGVYSDAMQLATFLNTRPIARPLIAGPVTVTGSGIVGETLTCAGATFKGDPADSVSYSWSNDFGPIAGAIGNTYVPKQDDIGLGVSCEITASNAGGDSTAFSDNYVVVGEGTVSAVPTETPTPAPTVDTNPPVVNLFSKGCKRSRCSVTVEANDESGVSGVEATVNKEVRKLDCTGAGCLTASSGSYPAISDASGRWTFKVRVPRKGLIKIKFSIRAIDQFGNVTPDYLNVLVKKKKE